MPSVKTMTHPISPEILPVLRISFSDQASSSLARNLYCYSCMSKRLESNWEFLWQMYRRPEQFSETCDPDHFRRGLVKLRNCTDYCIWINAETQVFGKRDTFGTIAKQYQKPNQLQQYFAVVYNLAQYMHTCDIEVASLLVRPPFVISGQKIPIYTRGCMSDVLNYRQDEPRIRKLRRKDDCVKLHLAELFNDGERKVYNNERVELCACHTNYCNGAPSGTSMASVRSTLPVVTVLLLLLVASGFWRCTDLIF